MKYILLALFPLSLAACAGDTNPQPLAPQDRLVQPGRADSAAYWDALDNVPGARTGEADYYYSHHGGGGAL